jgi:hypothetical protein
LAETASEVGVPAIGAAVGVFAGVLAVSAAEAREDVSEAVLGVEGAEVVDVEEA